MPKGDSSPGDLVMVVDPIACAAKPIRNPAKSVSTPFLQISFLGLEEVA